MEEIARVYSRALFDVARGEGRLDLVHEQLNQFTAAVEQERRLATFLFSPLFSTREKKEGLDRSVVGADRAFANFLRVLVDKHRMPVIFRIRDQFSKLWEEENRLLPVEVTSAIALDEATVREIGERIERQTGRRVQLTAKVDDGILGGLVVRVGNLILDASVRHQLERLRRTVAQAA